MSELVTAPYLSQEYYEEEKLYDLRTQFAELVDGNMRTEFNLYLVGSDIIGEDGRSLDKITSEGLESAKTVAEVNPHLGFEVRRRGIEREEFLEIVSMAKGEGPNTLIIPSDFPPELMDAEHDIGGYNVRRKQTMLRIIIRKSDGSLRMFSQSLDGSNRQALEAVYNSLGYEPEEGELLGQRILKELPPDRQDTLVDELTGVHDRNLAEQFGGEWHAGRQPVDRRNTYKFVCRQQDLISECLRLDRFGWLNDKFMYNVAAEMNRRYETEKQTGITYLYQPAGDDIGVLHQNLEFTGAVARNLGMTFSACGVTLEGNSLFEQAGYGGKSGEDQYGPLNFKCGNGHDNTRPYGQFISCCQICGVSVKC